MALRIGIDLGGTKTEIAALDEQGRTLLRRRAATPAGDYRATLRQVADLVRAAERELNQTGTVGIGTPGAISPASGRLRNSNSTCLNGQPVRQDLERLLERTVRVANDANCFVLSEALDGAAAGVHVAFGVILGTGVGGGLAVHGRVIEGANAIAGEWGHNALPWPADDERPGPHCYCRRRGCVETWLSGPGLERDHERHTGQRLGAAAIAGRAGDGDPGAQATLARYESRLARALAAVINVLDPHVIVLGGGLSNIARLYSNVPAQWGQWVFSDVVRTRLVRNRHGDSSGVRGAAFLGAVQ
jgi:predicted NBD/HSP70 family sugar kinase